ncbi:MAG: hypothetical protein WBA51_11610, partial [Erythrobacter sp.]
ARARALRMTFRSQPNYVKAAYASVSASAVLLISPFAFASLPLAPFLVGNWLLFIGVGYLAFFRPFRWKALVEQPERKRLLSFNVSLLAFTIGGWVAILNAERMF